jgi:hypothetical protein
MVLLTTLALAAEPPPLAVSAGVRNAHIDDRERAVSLGVDWSPNAFGVQASVWGQPSMVSVGGLASAPEPSGLEALLLTLSTDDIQLLVHDERAGGQVSGYWRVLPYQGTNLSGGPVVSVGAGASLRQQAWFVANGTHQAATWTVIPTAHTGLGAEGWLNHRFGLRMQWRGELAFEPTVQGENQVDNGGVRVRQGQSFELLVRL